MPIIRPVHLGAGRPGPIPSIHRFTDPNAYYPETEITDKSVWTEMDATTPAHKPWTEMAPHAQPPRVGDFVEFRVGPEVRFGLLLAPPPCLFNPFHNRSIILTIHNELVRACTQDFTFVCSQVLDEDTVPATEVLRHRFDEAHVVRRRLVQYLHQFLASVAQYRARVDMARVYSAIAGEQTMSVTLHEVAAMEAEKLPPWEGSSPACPTQLHQNALLMALYLNMCARPADWIVPHCFDSDRISNVAAHNASNAFPPPFIAMANSLALSQTLGDFMSFSEHDLRHVDDRLAARLRSSREGSFSEAYDRISLDLSGDSRLRTAVDAMRYAVAYPHTGLTSQLGRISAIGPGATSREIYDVLSQVGLYDNPCNPPIDPVLSSQVLGAVAPAAGSARDLQPSHTCQVAKAQAREFTDHFSHLRAGPQASGTHSVYIVPGSQGMLAFSVEQLSTRRHLLHVHVPDLAAYLAPASDTFRAWAQSPAETVDSAFPPELLAALRFQGRPSPAVFSVGDAQNNDASQSCMTLTFQYNSSFEDSVDDFSNLVSVTFDRLAVHRCVELSATVLEKTLTGRLEPSVFKKFRLFGHSAPAADESVTDEAHYELNFVYNMMQRHFESRNRHSALNVAQSKLHKTAYKKMSVVDDEVQTTVIVGDTSPQKSGFFRRELEVFAGRMASAACQRLNVPIFRRSQRLVFSEPRPDNDEVLISHDNSLLPDFTANSYFQAAYARDVSGMVSMSAFFHASNFVGLETVASSSLPAEWVHVTLGLPGYANLVPRSLEAYLNQLQIIQAVHFASLGRVGLFSKATDFAHLKALGYNLHGPADESLLADHAETFQASAHMGRYLHEKQSRYWILRAVETNRALYSQMKCTVTRASQDIDMQDAGISELHAVHVFCEDLGIEALMYTEPNSSMSLGSACIASVYHVDAISGQLILA